MVTDSAPLQVVSSSSRQEPGHWLNLAAMLPSPLPLPLDAHDNIMSFERMARIYSEECAHIELLEGSYGTDAEIPIPQDVAFEYGKYRPTPLRRARGLERALGYHGEIYFKREDMSPTGSHKPNTAIPQAYYARKQGLAELITDTGAGQWGCALGWSCHSLGLRCTVFMTRNSYQAKPYRRYLMQLAGTNAIASPSNLTARGRALLEEDPEHPGSLGIGMSEAMELVSERPHARLALGCMSYYAALHQTVIGNEMVVQLQAEGVEPELLIGCVGGGTNFTGFVSPFVAAHYGRGPWRGRVPRMLAVESDRIPVLTEGTYRYEYADAFGLTPKVKMYTLGCEFLPERMHAGGLRYHGKSPLLSYLHHEGIVEAAAVSASEAFHAGRLFFESEGILAAPESCHAIAQVMKEVSKLKAGGGRPTIGFCLSGTGYLDLAGYADVFHLDANA
jgi:tryptophan synthase beta chain